MSPCSRESENITPKHRKGGGRSTNTNPFNPVSIAFYSNAENVLEILICTSLKVTPGTHASPGHLAWPLGLLALCHYSVKCEYNVLLNVYYIC